MSHQPLAISHDEYPSVAYASGERRLCRREPCDGDSVRRRADVGEPDRVEEMHRRRVAAMFAADAELDVGTRLPSALNAHRHEVADAVHVDRGERILLEDLLVLVDLQELADVVAREAERQLREIVGAKREE